MENKNGELLNSASNISNSQSNFDESFKNINASEQNGNNIEVFENSISTGNSSLNEKSNSESEVEVLEFGFSSHSGQLNQQGKPVDYELLKNLAQDTNNLVNPDMINPLGKQKVQNIEEKVEEPKVDYEEIRTKKGYVFMAIVFLIIILFIIFLPQLLAFFEW